MQSCTSNVVKYFLKSLICSSDGFAKFWHYKSTKLNVAVYIQSTFKEGRHGEFKPGKAAIIFKFLANFGYHPLVIKFLEATIKMWI